LRYLNSASFGLSRRVATLRQALIHLGVEGVRRWASLILVTDLGRGKSPELLTLCLLRAAMCESLTSAAHLTASGPNLFLVGLLSLLDVLVGRPLGELLDEMAVPIDGRDALLRPSSRLGRVYHLVLAYERDDWPNVTERRKVWASTKRSSRRSSLNP
jgi:c-di-GMP-related signal transduction protein